GTGWGEEWPDVRRVRTADPRASGCFAGELDHPAGPEDRRLEGFPRLHRADFFADLRKICVALDRDTRHRQDDVATNHEVLPADGCDAVATEDAHVPGR